MAVTIKKKLEDCIVQEEEEVRLEIELSKPSLHVKWMKNNVVLQPGDNMEIHAKGAMHSLIIKRVAYADQGYYTCETVDDKTQAKLTVELKKIQLVKGLEAVKIYEGESVTFNVELSLENVEGVWTKDGIKLKAGPHCHITALGNKHTLTLFHLTFDDTGMISFEADGVHTSGRLTVSEPTVKITKPLVDTEVPEKGRITFECEISRVNTNVKWFKGTAELEPGKRLGIHSQGCKRYLQIDKCTCEDPARNIKIVKNLQDVEVAERENASFMCEITHDEVEGQWYKNNAKIKAGDNVKIKQEGRAHMLLFKSVKPEDTAEIKFTAEDVSSCAQLRVKELTAVGLWV
ncbi:hypothetical protein MATL_G00038610 [Megalops atlanticus]|uniref:non-specific serine/threonine protein kinase n=1 Tax=Megalops atlanticus TaxID=7932 RepID=A0A9D3QFC0_MEGAT|nr:hypothetical protein MATL_G00038610 [Megalops atlanticus]